MTMQLRWFAVWTVHSVCLCSAVHGQFEPTEKATILEATLDDYLRSIPDLAAEMVVTKVVRLSSGRISEKVFHTQCLMRDHVQRIAQYSHGTVEGERLWYDIRQSLVFPDGMAAEWRHPGLPGQLSFGSLSGDVQRVRHTAIEVGDPFAAQKRVLQVLRKDRVFSVLESPQYFVARSHVVAADNPRASDLQDDFIEIRFSREFGNLPVSMLRICGRDDPERAYESGAVLEMNYKIGEGGRPQPTSAKRDTRLKGDVKGLLLASWEIKSFDTATPRFEQMQLTVPSQVLAVESDSGRSFSIADDDDEDLNELPVVLRSYLSVRSRADTQKSVAQSFVGQCPDLSEEYSRLRGLPTEPDVADQQVAAGVAIWILHGIGCIVAALIFVARQRMAAAA